MKAVINAMDLYFVDSGNSSQKTIVFIHGFPFSHEMWNQQIDLLKKDYRVIAYDLRGHGGSGIGDGQYAFEFFVDDLIGLLDHLKIGRAILCGLSIGGYIALRAVERNPERVEGLILCDTQSEADSNEAKLRRAASIKAVKTNGVNPYAEGFVKAVFAPQSITAKAEVVYRIKEIIQSNSVLGICATLLALAGRTDTTASLPSIKVPTLILVGEHDTITPPRASREMHDKIPNSEFHIISNAAHMSNLENPEQFNEYMLDFLKKT
ncbi:MAG TPA: alpha/beta fold hydrolase [Candidatus Bathyarchaeia archaeon]|nr:alpha/beta fold hydrolase [Candidatus Bathyarchaeia archaeon]